MTQTLKSQTKHLKWRQRRPIYILKLKQLLRFWMRLSQTAVWETVLLKEVSHYMLLICSFCLNADLPNLLLSYCQQAWINILTLKPEFLPLLSAWTRSR